ncbi:ribosomal maturation YjgA family protein [Mucilaginibacter sp. HD30]
MKFNLIYFLLAAALFFIETAIAIYMDDAFIRPYFGDLLVVILIYCAVKAFINSAPIKTAIAVFFFACLIEVSQYFHLVQMLGLGRSSTATTVLGTLFSFTDIVMYALGTLVIIGTEIYFKRTDQNLEGTDGSSNK